MKQEYIQFKLECEAYLAKQSISGLRAYGRKIGVEKPTVKNKPDLIADILAVLTGEKKAIAQSLRGAPIKNDYVNPEMVETIENLRHRYFDDEYTDVPWHIKMLREMKENPSTIELFDSVAEKFAGEEYIGQLQTLNGVACLLPLSCRENESVSIIVPVDLIRRYDLREGDVLRCNMKKTQSENGFIVCAVMEINGQTVTDEAQKRLRFEDESAAYPTQTIALHGDGSVAVKALEWIVPVYKGQRACLISTPKAGKTSILYEITKSAIAQKDVLTYVLLIEQTPETVTQFRAILPEDQIVYTTYEDDEDKQVFTAEFLLKRAIRQVESGKDVLLIVDSLTALAHAFNNTDESSGGKVLAGGLESKTLHYLKKFFGLARSLENGKSLTMIGALSVNTGNVADDVLTAELSTIASLELHLSDELAIKRIYPAFDFIKTRSSIPSQGNEKSCFDEFLRTQYLPKYGNAALIKILRESKSLAELIEKAKK